MGGKCSKRRESSIRIHPQPSLENNEDSQFADGAMTGRRQQLPYQRFQDDSISLNQSSDCHILEAEQLPNTPEGFHPVCISSQNRERCFRVFNNLHTKPEEYSQRKAMKSILHSWNDNGQFKDIERYVSYIQSNSCSIEEIAIILTGDSARYLSTLRYDLHKQLAKLYAIYYWIATNIKYNVLAWDDLIAGKRQPDVSSEYVIDHRVTICSGYANLYKSIALEANLEVDVVEGHFRSPLCDQKMKQPQFFSPNKTNTHSWNAVSEQYTTFIHSSSVHLSNLIQVRLDGIWYLLDCTYASGTVNEGSFTPKFTSEYFLVPPEQMILTHWPDHLNWQLLEFPLNLQALQLLVVLTPSFFSLGIQLDDVQELLKIPSHSDDPVIKVTLNVSTNSQVLGVLNKWQGDANTSLTMKKYDKYIFNDRTIDGKVCLYVIIPDQGLYTLKLYTKNFCESSFKYCCSYLITCETDSNRSLGFPEVNIDAVQDYGFQLLYWSDNSQCTKSHIAECRTGELIFYFTADVEARFIHFIIPGRICSNDPNSHYHYYTSLNKDFKNHWKLHVIFPTVGLWTVCISNEKSNLLVMSYEVNVISLDGNLGWYPWIQSNTVKLVQSVPIKVTGKEVITVPFSTEETMEFHSLLINTSAVLIEYDQYTIISSYSNNKYELKIILPEPGKWIAHVLSRPGGAKSVDFSSLFSCYFDVDDGLPNTSFAISNENVTTKYGIKLLHGMLLECDVEHFVTRLKAPEFVHFHVVLQDGWSNRNERTSSRYNHCAFIAHEGNDIHRLEVIFPESGEWNLLVRVLLEQSLSHELVFQMKFKTTLHQSNMLFPKLYPPFYSLNVSIPSEYIPYICTIEDKLSFSLSVAKEITFLPVLHKNDNPDKEYYNQAIILPQGNSVDTYQLQAVFPDTGEWVIKIFGAERESTQDYHLVLELFYVVSKPTTGLAYPQLYTPFFTKYHMSVLKPSLLLPSLIQGVPTQLSFKLYKPEYTQIIHEARLNGTLMKGATQLVSMDDLDEYNFLADLNNVGEWDIRIFAKRSLPFNSAKCNWELVLTHTISSTS